MLTQKGMSEILIVRLSAKQRTANYSITSFNETHPHIIDFTDMTSGTMVFKASSI